MRAFKNIFFKYSLEEVFTPSTSAEINFVKRPFEESELISSIKTPGKQIIIYGHSGSGKTTLLRNTMKSLKKEFISIICQEDTTLEQIIKSTFDELNSYYVKSRSKLDTKERKFGLAQTGLNKNKAETSVNEKSVDFQLTPQRLAKELGIANKILVIEDFHKVQESERKKLSQMLKIFVDEANTYKDIKICAIGAVGTARQVVNYNSELVNRVAEIFVPLLNNSELKEIITRGQDLLNVEIDPNTIEEIVKLSSSLGAVCHQLCANLCEQSGIQKTQIKKQYIKPEKIRDSINKYLRQNSDSLKEVLDRALNNNSGFENSKYILKYFCNKEKDEASFNEIKEHREIKRKFPSKIELKANLDYLLTAEGGELIRYDSNSGKYSFSSPFFKAYAVLTFKTEETGEIIDYNAGFEQLMEIFIARSNKIYKAI